MGASIVAFAAVGIMLAILGTYFNAGEWTHGDTTGVMVVISSGKINGQYSNTRPQVYEFLGIPYAQPPVGELRFAAPVRFKSDQTIDAFVYVSGFRNIIVTCVLISFYPAQVRISVGPMA